MLIDPEWIPGALPWDAEGVVLVPVECEPDEMRLRKMAQISSEDARRTTLRASVWSADDEDARIAATKDHSTLDEAKAWCVQRLRELGHTFVGDPTVLELAERIAVLESLVHSMQMGGGHEK